MSETNKMKFGIKELIILILIASLVFFFLNYSWIGVRLCIGILLLYFIPFYIFLDSFNLAIEEKLIFSFFISIGLIPLIVYYISRLLVSVRLSILVSFLILIVGSFIFRKFYKGKKSLFV